MEAYKMDAVGTWLNHIRVLTEEIGPRGSTTPGERKGAEYCQRELERMGYAARLETFTSARSIYQPHLIAASFLLAAFIIYPLAGQLTAAVAAGLSLLALVSQVMELGFLNNPLRLLLSKGQSQNAVAVIPPAAEHRQDLVLIGHIDTHRTPLIFSTRGWVTAYENFITVAFVAFASQVILYTAGAFIQLPWIWPASAFSALCAVLLIAVCLQADSTPFNDGANDNASAVGIVLTLAEHLRAQPLQHTRVWVACTGCEEVQHYGAIDFFQHHRAELIRPAAIAFEMLGCAGPSWLTREGILVPFQSAPRLRGLAEELSNAHPEWGAYPAEIKGGNTEMVDALRAGVPAITLTGLTRQGKAPYWHQPGDTFDKMDPEVLCRAYDFTWTYLNALDQQAAEAN
jgi:hypothetical protein